MDKTNDDWDNYLEETLTEPKKIADYLTACFSEGTEVFLLALKDVINARDSFPKEASMTKQEAIETLSHEKDPYFSTISNIVSSLGFKFSIQMKS